MKGLLIGGALLLWYLSRKSDVATKLDYVLRSVDISKGKLYIVLELINPTYKELKVDSINLKVYNVDLLLGRVNYFDPVTIVARNRTLLKLPVEINAGADLGKFIAAVIKGTVSSIDVKGSILAMGFSFDVDENLNLK